MRAKRSAHGHALDAALLSTGSRPEKLRMCRRIIRVRRPAPRPARLVILEDAVSATRWTLNMSTAGKGRGTLQPWTSQQSLRQP